jgi:hypothetical protein
MPTLILPPPPVLPTGPLAFAAQGQRWQVETLSGPPALDRLRGRSDVALYGHWPVVTHLARMLHLTLLAPTVDWLPRLPEAYRRRWVRLLTADEARQRDEPAFLKPMLTRGWARLYTSGAEVPDAEVLPPSEPVLASEPVSWDLEFRCFARERSVAALALYARDGQPLRAPGVAPPSEVEVQEVTAFTEKLLTDAAVALPPALVVDVGRIADRGWAVLAAGPAWCRDRTFCDAKGVLAAVQRACVSSFRVAQEDQPWIVANGCWAVTAAE